MKKIIILLILSLTVVLCFAQAFDDLPYTNPDSATWLQQEMSSLMRFQFENDINVPFFVTLSIRNNSLRYKPEYTEYLRSFNYTASSYSENSREEVAEDLEIGFLLGGQIKLNSSFYLPVFVSSSYANYESVIDGEWEEYQKDNQVLVRPYSVGRHNYNNLLGTGLNINTDKLKGGVYLCYTFDPKEGEEAGEGFNTGLKIAIVPLVDTSSMAYIGKALSSVMGYFGMGNAVIRAEEETGNSKISAFINTINAGLDFTFNRLDFELLSMQANAVYLRGNYNLVAKTDTFGLKLQGRLSRFPLGFSAEGGYKHFFSVSPYLEPYYPDTGYINASLFFPLKYFTVGAIYQYDIIYESKFIFAVSTNFLSGYYAYNPRNNYNKDQFDGAETTFNFGSRFRWGGWKAKAGK